MKKNYIREVEEIGYTSEHIPDFQNQILSYLGERFFFDKQAKILDIGSGSGHSIIPFKKFGWNNLWAADSDNFNKDFFQNQNIKFNKIDIESDRFSFQDYFFDAVISFNIIEHIKDASNYLEEVNRILKKGGVFILVTPDWRNQYKTFYRDHTHIHPYDKESIGRLLKCYNFKLLTVKSFGVIRGFGRLKIWKLFKSLMFTGINMIVICKK